MSEERFDRIEEALARLETGQVQLQVRLDGVDQRLDGVGRRLDVVDQRLAGVDQRIGELDRHMHVLHEEALDRIATVPDHMSRLQVKLDEIASNLRETLGRRLDPLEAAVRDHSQEIAALKKKRR